MATHKWTINSISKLALHTFLVTNLGLCCLESLYTAPLHETDLSLVIVTDKFYLTCLRTFASGTGIRQISFAGVSQSANVHKIRSFKGRLQKSLQCFYPAFIQLKILYFTNFSSLGSSLENQYLGKSGKNDVCVPKINFWKWGSALEISSSTVPQLCMGWNIQYMILCLLDCRKWATRFRHQI